MKKVLISILFAVSALVSSAQGIKYNGEFGLQGSSVINKDLRGSYATLETCHGVQFGGNVFLGAGAGVAYATVTEDVVLPVFVQGRFYFSDQSKVRPFVTGRIGALIDPKDNLNPGFFFSPKVGVRISKFAVSLGYTCLNGTETLYVYGGVSPLKEIKNNFRANMITLGVSYILF